MTYRVGRMSLALLTILLGCAHGTRSNSDHPADALRPPEGAVALVRTRSLRWEGEQTYIPLYADGTASGLVVVNLAGGRLYGTATPDSWTWVAHDTVEICTSVTVLRNEVGFPPMERDCARHPIAGKELDLDGDGKVDLVETFTISHPLFYRDRPLE